MYSTRYPYPLKGKTLFAPSRKKAHQKQKSWWRKITRVASVERKIHSVEHARQGDFWIRLPYAKKLRAKLRGCTPIALKKVCSITGDYFQGRWKNQLLEIQYLAGQWHICLRSPLTQRVLVDRVGKRRNPTLSRLLGREIVFVKNTSDLLVFHVLHQTEMKKSAPVQPQFGKVTLSSTEPQLISDFYPDSLKETRVGHKIHVQGTQLFFTRK